MTLTSSATPFALRWPGLRHAVLLVLIAGSLLSRYSVEVAGITVRPEHLSVLLGLAGLFVLWRRGQAALKPGWDDALLAAYMVLAGIAALLFPPNPLDSLKFFGLMVLAVANYYLVRMLIRSKADLYLAVRVLLVLGVVEAAYGIVTWLLYPFGARLAVDRYPLGPWGPGGLLCSFALTPSGTLFEPNIFGSFVMLIAVLLALFFLSPRFREWQRWTGIGLFVVLVAIGLNTSRSALLSVLLGLGLVLLLSDEPRVGVRLRWGLVAAFVLAVVYLGSVDVSRLMMQIPTPANIALQTRCAEFTARAPAQPPAGDVSPVFPLFEPTLTPVPIMTPLPRADTANQARDETASGIDRLLNPNTIGSRLAAYRFALVDWIERPWLGNGPNSFAQRYTTTAHTPGWISNLLLMTLHDTGVVGLALLLAFLGLVGWRHLQFVRALPPGTFRVVLLALGLGAVGLFVAYQFTSALWLGFAWVYLGLLRAGMEVEAA